MGAILGAVNVGNIRRRFGGEASVRACALLMGIATVAAAISRQPVFTAVALAFAGTAWMMAMALFNIAIQLSAPRWVSGRALAGFCSASAGGLALGRWVWGHAADQIGIDNALLVSAIARCVSPMVSIWLKVPEVDRANQDMADWPADPEVLLALTPRSGPISRLNIRLIRATRECFTASCSRCN